MSKSIWDTRFNNRGIAQDEDADENDRRWITMHGARILIDDDGTIIGGAEGKFTGQNLKDVVKEESNKKYRDIRQKNDAVSHFDKNYKQKKKDINEEYSKVKNEEKAINKELLRRGRNAIRPDEPMPSYVKNVDTDKDGKEVPYTRVPPNLDTAARYFGYVKADYENMPGSKEKVNMYDDLERAAKDWQQFTINEVRHIENQNNDDVSQELAEAKLKPFFKYADKEPCGVAKWMGTDMYHKVEKFLPPERQKYYSNRIKKWK